MKILTLNTHSLVEKDYEKKLGWFVEAVCREKPDIIALQEVNQSADAPEAEGLAASGFVRAQGEEVPVRQDNHAFRAAKMIREAGILCSWTWISAKLGYGKYDEGMAFLVPEGKILETDYFYISRVRDYNVWKTRKVLGIRAEGLEDWFYTAHMGWWEDEEEPFLNQWQELEKRLKGPREQGTVWLMGDFNSPAAVRGQGYDYIKSHGWQDTWELAEKKDSGITVEGVIDGWRKLLDEKDAGAAGMRIDHIWCSKKVSVASSNVMFNGRKEPKVSDHFGVFIETKKKGENRR